MSINHMTDWTHEEFMQLAGSKFEEVRENMMTEEMLSSLPKQVGAAIIDWNNAGKVHPVKNQGNCGSCWAFAATGAAESSWAIYHGGSPPNLSEQQLVDCAWPEGSHGCAGGLMNAAYTHLYYHPHCHQS